MLQHCLPAFRLMIAITFLTGLFYPALVTGIVQIAFPIQANGSLVRKEGHVVGSRLIGQNFTRPEYFHPRPSAAGSGYDATASGGSNLGPTSAKLRQRVQQRVAEYRRDNTIDGDVPGDAVSTSGSGLDPDISPENAMIQAGRVARARAAGPQQILRLIQTVQEARDLGVLGEPRVNVLRLNMELDRQFPLRK